MILDRENRIAYCSLSKRSNEDLFYTFCEDFKFKPLVFKSYQSINGKRLSIYHTNVMMCIASEYAVICLDAVDNFYEKKRLVETIVQSGKEVIELKENQIEKFAGNMLELKNNKGSTSLEFRKKMAQLAFTEIAYYDSIIANYFNKFNSDRFPKKIITHGNLIEKLRYGENPHQESAIYSKNENPASSLFVFITRIVR